MTVVLILIALVVIGLSCRAWLRRRARNALLSSALSSRQRAIVAKQVPITKRLPKELRAGLEGKIQLFLNQIDFIGCDGLKITEDMQLSIAAQACLLVVNSDAWYRNLRTILVYPGAFKSRKTYYDGYVVTERDEVRLGESWARGPVVLSWSHTEEGAMNDRDGRNVVFHEFAHQLDDLSGHTDGAPILPKGQSFAEWERVFATAYEKHGGDVKRGRKTVIDAYGAEGPEEFFAVSVELFFERPQALCEEEPDIYGQLVSYLGLHPANWG